MPSREMVVVVRPALAPLRSGALEGHRSRDARSGPKPGVPGRKSERPCGIKAHPVLGDPAGSQSVVGFLLARFIDIHLGI